MTGYRFKGVLVPVVTPFRADYSIDLDRFFPLCSDLLARGANGLAIFGTTSEANSISARARMAALEGLIQRGIPAERLLPGVGACALEDAAELIRHATALGCGGVLMLPPFYYKGVTDEGLFRFVSGVIERTKTPARIYLYHIPPVAQVGFSLDLIGRLIDAFPGAVVGIKDSSGDMKNTLAVIERFPKFDVFAGSEVFLLDTLRAGGVGCITATGSVNLPGIRTVLDGWQGPTAQTLQDRATLVRQTIQKFPMIPAVKSIISRGGDDAGWKVVLPPLVALDAEAERRLFESLDAIGFVHESAAPRQAKQLAATSAVVHGGAA